MKSTIYTISGMTCDHCVSAVQEELGALPGVTDVAVELNAGGDSPVTITSEGTLDDAAISASVDEAGYEVR